MKPIYLKPDKYLLFVAMKEEPHGMASLNGAYHPIINGYVYAKPIKPPFLSGEECYVREALHKGINISSSEYCSIHYPDDTPVLFKDGAFMGMFGRAIWQWGGLRLPIIAMPQWASRRHVRIVSCEPIRVEDVTEEDIIKAGLADGSCVWANGAARCNANGDLVINQFMDNWHKKHHDKQWAWRVETTNIKGE
jgi:hypothetical protein